MNIYKYNFKYIYTLHIFNLTLSLDTVLICNFVKIRRQIT